jgi:hypothetical protein
MRLGEASLKRRRQWKLLRKGVLKQRISPSTFLSSPTVPAPTASRYTVAVLLIASSQYAAISVLFLPPLKGIGWPTQSPPHPSAPHAATSAEISPPAGLFLPLGCLLGLKECTRLEVMRSCQTRSGRPVIGAQMAVRNEFPTGRA